MYIKSEKLFVCLEWAIEVCQNRRTDMRADGNVHVSANHEVN